MPLFAFLMMISQVLQANYIRIHYNINGNLLYNSGFANNYRSTEDLDHLRDTSDFSPSQQFAIAPSSANLEIHFKNAISTLESYFDANYDINAAYIDSVDFSNFDSSHIACLNYLFKGVTELKYVNFANFNSSGLTALKETFSDCSALSSIDLSFL